MMLEGGQIQRVLYYCSVSLREELRKFFLLLILRIQKTICVKSAVLKVNWYRKHIDSDLEVGKNLKNKHVEFVREIQTHFIRCCSASGVKTLSDLRQLVLLEQFKNSMPPRIATYVVESTVHTAYDAAGLADEFALMHRNQFGQKKFKDSRRELYGFTYDKSRENFDLSRTR